MTSEAEIGAELGEALAALGFERNQQVGAIVWRGRLGTRECSVKVNRQSRTRYAGEVRYREQLGYRLRVELATPVRARLFFVKESFATNPLVRFVYRLRKQSDVGWVPPELQGFRVVTVDPSWAAHLLAERGAMQDAAHLLRDGATTKLAGSVYFQPEKIHYASPILLRESLSALNVIGAIERLERIAQAAEAIAAPSVACESTRFELFAQKNPAVTAILFLGGCLGLLFVAGLMIFFAFFLLHR